MSPLALVIPILNTLALLATLGVFYYTRLKYHRPSITEESERVRIAKVSSEPVENIATLIQFEPVTVNIASTPIAPHPSDGTVQQIQGKLHYVTLSFSLELQNRTHQSLIESSRPAIMDHLLLLLGKRQFHELTTVQGRYILRSQLMEFANKLIAASNSSETDGEPNGMVSNIYFNQFLVQ